MTRGATVRFRNRRLNVHGHYVGWGVWVANLFDQYVEIRAGDETIATFPHRNLAVTTYFPLPPERGWQIAW